MLELADAIPVHTQIPPPPPEVQIQPPPIVETTHFNPSCGRHAISTPTAGPRERNYR
jgi:hypothetical protein